MKKPRNSWVNPDPYYYWDWPGRPASHLTPMGNGMQVASGGEPVHQTAVANLWVPDIEQVHGWREHYVWPDPPVLPPDRRAGFRK